jgi:tetratricopeptide (TPR) repeat protein
LILIYEDLHWIDSSTEACLSALLDAVAGAPILLILTYRPGYTPPFGSRSFATTLALQSLSASDTLSMARRILRTDTLPGALETLLLDKTEGVPLFVEEVIKTLQDVAYNSLLVRQRRDLHRVVGAAIEELYPERLTEHYEELAHHFTQGEVWSKAMTYSTLAGDRAAASYANAEASVHYAHAIEAATHLTPSPDSGVVARLYAKQGNIRFILGEHEEAFATYQVALDLIRQAGDQQGEIDILLGLSRAYMVFHRADQGIAAIDQALNLAQSLEDRAAQALSLSYRAWALSSGHGQLTQALPDAEAGVRFATDLGRPNFVAQTHAILGQVLQWQGDLARARPYLSEALAQAQHEHMGFWSGLAMFGLGHACTSGGRYEEALQWYQRLRDYAFASGDNFFMIRVPNLCSNKTPGCAGAGTCLCCGRVELWPWRRASTTTPGPTPPSLWNWPHGRDA